MFFNVCHLYATVSLALQFTFSICDRNEDIDFRISSKTINLKTKDFFNLSEGSRKKLPGHSGLTITDITNV